MGYEPLHHKYRPQTFAQLVGQEAIATTLTTAIRQQKIAPAYLFTGARGTGKTSSARILAKSLNCLESAVPTEKPCGVCESCRMIANGTALDVIEIDAASNTGVDNIRELIERSQFAPVQCRYKVYVIDECLTGDSLVLTEEGLVRIDDPAIVGKKVLSHNDALGQWEFKRVLRWLDQGRRQTRTIKTTHREIRCTDNHLIRTEQGWIAAKDVKEGMTILSPVNVGAEPPYTSTGQMGASADLLEGISSRGIPTEKSLTALQEFWKKLNYCVLTALVDAAKNLMSLPFSSTKVRELVVSKAIGNVIPTKNDTVFGSLERKDSLMKLEFLHQKFLDWFTGHFWGIALSPTPTLTADFHDWLGRTAFHNKNGQSTKLIDWFVYEQLLESLKIMDMEASLVAATQPAIPDFNRFLILPNQMVGQKQSLSLGSPKSHLKDWLGGTWMMDHWLSVLAEVLESISTRKDSLHLKINLWLNGSLDWDMSLRSFATKDQVRSTVTSKWERMLLDNGWQISSNTSFSQWHTSLEKVESVSLGGIEPVYDIEVEDNHNFVANGLLVHNCHMLSTAAFNALLKTLEEPPDRVVFVLATTDPQRVLPTIISRCQRFDYRRIPLDAMVAHLQMIAQQEAIAIHSSAVQLVAQISQGGLRDAESLLDQLSLIEGEITTEAVWDLVGAVPEKDLLELVKAIANDNATTVLEQARKLMDRGREPLIVLQNLASFYRDLLIAKTSPQRPDLVAITAPTWAEMCDLVQPWSQQLILQGQQKLRESELQVKQATQPRLWLEVALLQLLPSALVTVTAIDPRATQPIKPSPTIPPPISAPISPPISAPVSPAISPPVSQTPKQSSPPPSVPDLDQETDMPLSELDDILSSSSTPAIEEITQASEMRSLSELEVSEPEVSEPKASEPELVEPKVSEPELVEPEVSPLDFFAPKPSESPEIIFTTDQVDPTETSSDYDLPKIWTDVLNLVQPYSTRIMLQQQCQLLRFDGTSAIVGTKTDKLFKMAQERQPNIQKAFDALYGQPIYLKLQVGGSNLPPSPPPQSKSSAPRSPQPQPPAPQSATPPAAKPTPPPPTPSANPTIEPPIDPSMDQFPPAESASQVDADQQETAPPGVPQVNSMDATSTDQNPPSHAPSVEVDPMMTQWYEPDSVRDAAKNLAQFFNGQIVDLEDEVAPEVGIEELVEEQGELELGEGEPDKDVPF